ncbi:chemotaxis protein CheW [Alloiococcus sp. CFN-8]|uniref:chemotaxis protein CheW n=1 Tax=Alloiococcus sp. CFN-8 TaxID=3416081 RepID=UPI003CF7D320
MQIVIFNVNNEQFAIEANQVEGINEILNITKVPKSPDYVLGLINLRGNIITILDIHKLLNMPKDNSSENNIIIVNVKNEVIGIVVDQVDEVIEIETLNIKNDEIQERYIKGIIQLQDRIITLITLEEIIN